MRLRSALPVILVLCATTGFAEKPFPPEVTPTSELATAETATSKLPEALQKSLLEQEVFAGESGKLPSELFSGKFDLTGDSAPEYLVEDPASYTGGTMTYIFEKKGAAYSVLGGFQGIQYLAAPVNGYPQIVTFSRSGPDAYVRNLYVFKDGQYQSVRGAKYEYDANDNQIYRGEVEN